MAKLAAVLVDLVTSATNKTFTYIVRTRSWAKSDVEPRYGFLLALGFLRYVVPETPEPVEKVRPISAVLAQNLFNEELGSWHALWLIAIYAIRLRLCIWCFHREQVADYL